jgi:hypothetical protein
MLAPVFGACSRVSMLWGPRSSWTATLATDIEKASELARQL